jgi:hypothetical protein
MAVFLRLLATTSLHSSIDRLAGFDWLIDCRGLLGKN